MRQAEDQSPKPLPIVGIDLGTTNSSIAYINPKGKPEILPSFKGEDLIPSAILIEPNGRIVIGQDAKDAAVAMPQRTLTAVKRQMGKDVQLPIADTALLPQEASALILKELKKYADTVLGEGEKEAVITVPAYFTDEQRKATRQAGELAGFIVERIINEPTAAALAYGLNNLKKDGNILVYDLGGGTFDVSVVEMMKGILEVKASAGNNHLGGEDFDWKLVDFMAEYMQQQYGVDPRLQIQAKSILKAEAEKIKIRLSVHERVEISIPIVMMEQQKPLGIFTEITRNQFEAMIEKELEETMGCVRQAMADARLLPEEIHWVLLVGGSTAIPRVSQLLETYFQKKPKKEIDPDRAVALGAAVQAGIKSGTLGKNYLIATDVAPFSMGVAVLKEWQYLRVKSGGFHKIIPRNTTIPVTRTETFQTTGDGQTQVSIEIYQGEAEWVKDNHRLGEFLLEGIPPRAAGEEKIDITFRYNLNGILEITAHAQSTGKEMTVSIQDEFKRDSLESFQDSVAKIEALLSDKAASPSEDPPEPDWFDFDEEEPDWDADDEGLKDWETADVSELIEELDSLNQELAAQIAPPKQIGALPVGIVQQLVQTALKEKDRLLLIEAIEEITDLLIKLKIE